ncbi:MAG: DUF4386 domain-containing protein [Actinomycetota bacterium]|nr:DUF4386 domain-containing protein [Actinomycetota bacterium]
MRRSAFVAGVAYLALAVLAGAGNFGAIEGLVTKGDATRTANDILASEELFRFGIAALVVVVILDIVVAWALLTFFEPVHEGLARLAAWLRLIYAGMLAVAISQLVGVLPILGDRQYLTTVGIDRPTEALMKIQTFHDIWTVALVLFGLHLMLIGYLAYTSGYVPRLVGIMLVIAGVGYLFDSFGGLLVASYSVSVATVTFVGEVALILWLLVKGRQVTLA